MRAAFISQFGEPYSVEVRDVAEPALARRHVLVRVLSAALNRADLLQARGKYPASADVASDIPGIEFAGTVVRSAPDASRWRDGDRVFAISGGAAQAEYVAAHEDMLASVPEGVSDSAAGAIPEAFVTVHDALISQADLKAGERVLIHAVASGVGLAAVQLCRAWGAIPYGTSRTESKLASARAVGLENGVALGSDPREMLESVSAWTGGVGMDVVLDLAGGAYVPAGLESLALRGRLMLIGTMAGGSATIDLRRVLGKRLTIRGSVLRSRPLQEKIAAMRAFAEDVVPRLAAGTMKPVIDCVYPLERVAEAYARLESNATVGKVVLTM